MSEDITTVIELPELRNRIKAEDSKAQSIAKKSLAHVIECGRLLIELKSRVNHGHWKYEARHLNMSPRTISNYMRIAQNGNVAVLGKGVRDALRLLSIAESPPPAKATAPALPDPPAPSPRLPQVTIEAEIVEPVKADLEIEDDRPAAPPAGSSKIKSTPEDGLMIQTTARSVMDRILPKDVHFEAAMKAMAKYCGEKIASKKSAPSAIEASEATLAEIVGLLPRLRPAETKELHRVIESRWLKGGRP